jgi:hypothetical protein
MEYQFKHNRDMTEDELIQLFVRCESEGLVEAVFYDGYVKTVNDWLALIDSQPTIVVKVERPDGELGGFWWLNGFVGKSAMLHFCWYGKDLEAKKEMTRQSVLWLAKKKVLKSMYGITPKHYRHVLKFIEELGWELRGPVQGACYFARKDKYVNGIISVIDLTKYEPKEVA